MIRRTLLVLMSAAFLYLCLSANTASADERAYGRVWGGAYGTRDWERFYHYPYVFYPQNFWGHEYYRSAEDMMYRYPAEMRIPVYNQKWFNFYPSGARWHSGHHYTLDVL